MSIKLKLTIVLGMLALLLVGTMLGAYFSMQSVNRDMNSVVADRVVPLKQLNSTRTT